MFSSLGLFKNIVCPKRDDCALPGCLFSHPLEKKIETEASAVAEYDPFSAGSSVSPPSPPSPPPSKRRKISHKSPAVDYGHLEKSLLDTPQGIQTVVSVQTRPDGEQQVETQVRTVHNGATGKAQPKSITRPVSPPPSKIVSKASNISHGIKSPVKVETLTPRKVPKAPAQLKIRLQILEALHAQLVAQNKKLETGSEKRKALVLSDQELIKLALDEEEEAAVKLESDIYRSSITQRVLRLRKMSQQDWIDFVEAWRNSNAGANLPMTQKSANLQEVQADTRTLTVEEEVVVLRQLRTPLEGLEAYGYVTTPPTIKQITDAKAASKASGGWETCDRCRTRFQVFPGRDEQGRLTTRGPCRYHWAKIARRAFQKTERVTGQAQAIYGCCNQPVGGEGCTEAESHVFKVSDAPRLAEVLQFERTPVSASTAQVKHVPVSFDCEMGYTTKGMEVIRVTAVGWPESSLLLDVLVRPYGEVLDLNTRFSGVTNEQFANAALYNTGKAEKQGDSITLRKVDSPAAARQLLFNLLTPDTPLIGHAIENDLNVVRIIHPFIIDTVLLFSHPRGLPFRYGLKQLTARLLHRNIQMGGEAGHDSQEDAVATGELVTLKVMEKWKTMVAQSYRFEDGRLMEPETISKKTATPKAFL